MPACHGRRNNWPGEQWRMPASQPVSQPFFGYWFWLLVPDKIMGRFVLRGLYLYPLYPLVVSSTPKGQAAGSLTLCLVCAGSKAAPTVTNGCSWNNESLFSKSELLREGWGFWEAGDKRSKPCTDFSLQLYFAPTATTRKVTDSGKAQAPKWAGF